MKSVHWPLFYSFLYFGSFFRFHRLSSQTVNRNTPSVTSIGTTSFGVSHGGGQTGMSSPDSIMVPMKSNDLNQLQLKIQVFSSQMMIGINCNRTLIH